MTCHLFGLLTTHWKWGPQDAGAGDQPSSVPDSLHPRADSAHCFKKFFPISSLLFRTTSGFFGFFNIFEILLNFKTSKCLRLRKKISIFPLIQFCLVFLENINFVHAARFKRIDFPSAAIDILVGEVFLL